MFPNLPTTNSYEKQNYETSQKTSKHENRDHHDFTILASLHEDGSR